MSVGKITFKGVDAPTSQPQEQTKVSFKGQENPIDEEKSNATKYMIGATALAGIAALAIAGYHGHLGEGIQKFLGGAEKAAKKGGASASESASHTSSGRWVEDLEDDLNRGAGCLDDDLYVTRGLYGQDINDPLEPMNAYDMLSPYYQQPIGAYDSQMYGYGSSGLGGVYGF